MANFAMGPDKLAGITARTLFVASGRGLPSFPFQLNLSCFVGHTTQLNP
jgi:hypothetical protein